jgi:hypothetical protein
VGAPTPLPHFARCLNSGSEAVELSARLTDIHAKTMTSAGGPHAGWRTSMMCLDGSFYGCVAGGGCPLLPPPPPCPCRARCARERFDCDAFPRPALCNLPFVCLHCWWYCRRTYRPARLSHSCRSIYKEVGATTPPPRPRTHPGRNIFPFSRALASPLPPCMAAVVCTGVPPPPPLGFFPYVLPWLPPCDPAPG